MEKYVSSRGFGRGRKLKMSKKEQNTSTIGYIGESIACNFLENKGFHVKERNFRKPFGEIDIIAEERGILYFIEVKTVSCEIYKGESGGISRENTPLFNPEENVTPQKRSRLQRAVEAYIGQNNVSHETEWRFWVLAIYIDRERKRSLVEVFDKLTL